MKLRFLSYLRFPILILVCLIQSQPVSGVTVSGTLTQSATWTENMNPVQIVGRVRIANHVQITVLANTHIQFTTGSRMEVEGRFSAIGTAGRSVRILSDTSPTNPGFIEADGPHSLLGLVHCEIRGVEIQVLNRGDCQVKNCKIAEANRMLLLNDAKAPEIVQTTFSDANVAIESIRSSPRIEGCRFLGISEKAVSLNRSGMDYGPPASLRIRGPNRMVAGKTTTLWVEVLDSEGNLYWPLWDATGSVTAKHLGSGIMVPLTVDNLEFTNGIACLTTSLSEVGVIEIEISVAGVSSVHQFDSFPLEGHSTLVFGGLPPGDQTWNPEGGVYHVAGRVVVPQGTRLIIEAGTLLMMDPGVEIDVLGDIEIRGTQENPVYFFPTDPEGPWKQLRLRNIDKTFEIHHAYFSGGADGPKETGEEHTFDGPMLRFRPLVDETFPQGGRIEGCLFSDAVGKGIFTHYGGRYEINGCLFVRLDYGLEMHGDEIQIRNSYVIQLNDGSDDPDDDQDGMYLWRPKESHTIDGCIVTGSFDDNLDAFESSASIRNSLIYGARDKNITYFRSSGTIENCLIFGGRYGLFFRELPGQDNLMTDHCTIVNETAYGARVENMTARIENSIIWDNVTSLFHFGVNLEVNHSDIDSPLAGVPGTGNLNTVPRFVDKTRNDFRLSPDSPLNTASSTGHSIGWQGFPQPGAFPPIAIPLISGCRFSEGSGTAIHLEPGSEVMIETTLIDRFQTGITGLIDSSINGTQNTILGCETAVSLQESSLELDNSILWDNQTTVNQGNSTSFITFSNSGPPESQELGRDGNISKDPLFLNPLQGDYRLKPDSPSAGTGLEGSDMGAFPALTGKEKTLLQIY